MVKKLKKMMVGVMVTGAALFIAACYGAQQRPATTPTEGNDQPNAQSDKPAGEESAMDNPTADETTTQPDKTE